MRKKLTYIAVFSFVLLLVLAAVVYTDTQPVEKGEAPPAPPAAPPAPPPAREIPGITAKDAFPGGCVDCHIYWKDMDLDTRFSTHMKQWSEKVDPKLLARVQPFAPEGLTLKGKHPAATASLKDIPAACLKCHSKTSKMAPPFGRMLHGIHLGGGKESPYLTFFQGECTHCHKLDLKTGTWSMPSGPEK